VQYLRIAKLPIVGLFMVTSLAAMLIAGRLPAGETLAALAGIALTVAGSAALNNYLERDVDARMQRTRRRPTAAGTLPPARALVFGVLVTLAGIAAVWAIAGPLAAGFAAAGAFYYVVVYTLLLKPHLALSSIPGAVAGAFPALAGWAATGAPWSAQIASLCAVIVVWSPPHFWALALARSADYVASGIPSPAARYGERGARWLILGGVVAVVAVSLAPVVAGLFGDLYLAVAACVGAAFLGVGAHLVRAKTTEAAWLVHKLSGPYLGILMAAMVVDALL
jgi:heme o synthase